MGGIWISNDGGKTWKNLGLTDTRHITRIVINPINTDIVIVTALGRLFGSNTERGVFKTIDGGITWKKILFANENAGAIDLIADPNNFDILYASPWCVRLTPYSMESGGEGNALWKSVNGGSTWVNISKNKGFPKDTIGIIGIATSAVNRDKLYAIIESKTGGVFKSEDAGVTRKKINDNNDLRQRSWYFSKIFCDPQNENVLYILNVGLWKSKDGGKTFTQLYTPHVDHHDLRIDPDLTKRLIIGDDGGANWSKMNNQATAQIYRVTTDNHFPNRIYGAQQDNSSIRILSRSYSGSISNKDWEPTAGFESGHIVADPLNNDIVYGGNYGGYLSRLNHKTGENNAISLWPDNPMGAGADLQRYRFQWNFPLFFSPYNSKKLYTAGNVLFVSENEGANWKAISPDLTRNVKEKQLSSGGTITKDNTSVEYYCTIFTAIESTLEKDMLVVGSDDGLLHITKDGGQNWKNITPKGMPEWMKFNAIEEDPFDKGTFYVVGTNTNLTIFLLIYLKLKTMVTTGQRL